MSVNRLFIPVLVLATLVVFFGWNSFNTYYTHNSDSERQLRSELACNTLSYLYVVGVEGVGHHAVTPALATIAKTCNMHVLYEMKQLRNDQQRKSSKEFQAHLSKIGSTHFASANVVMIEDSSFPTGSIHRNATSLDPRSRSYYDIAWTQKELIAAIPHLKVKYLYLNRDFYRTVASHSEFDGGFQRHAQVLHSFMGLIRSEYRTLNKKQPDIWRQISYEWFTNMDTHNCTAIVSAIVDFMEWNDCDVEFACHALSKVVRSERRKEVVPEDFAYAQTFNVSMPIPVLDITPNRTYTFRTAVYRHPDGFSKEHDMNRSVQSVLYDAPPKPEHVRSSLSGAHSTTGKHDLRGAQHGGRFAKPTLAAHCDHAGGKG